MLVFDGSEIGQYEFHHVIRWLRPVTPYGTRLPVMMALLQIGGQEYPVYLKRAPGGSLCQALVDELKPLFGLTKIGCHRIRLHGVPQKIVPHDNWVTISGQKNFYIMLQWSDYLIFRAETEPLGGKPIFIMYSNLDQVRWIPDQITPDHQKFFFELQKIFVFRDLCRVSDTGTDNVLIKYNPNRSSSYSPLSIDEMQIRSLDQTYKWLNITTTRFFFPQADTKAVTVIRMFNLTPQNYREIIWQLKESLTQCIQRLAPEYLWLSDYIVSKLTNLIDWYFSKSQESSG